ncbi:MAG: bacillithiol biosynthesis cysteine-adding enzyme BshC, partial [Melioribacteraceae bacterium]|nr:bacillithiol biosynthesis cysteine-adding enzyme BshC [Melioribacteraceae bacterium]
YPKNFREIENYNRTLENLKNYIRPHREEVSDIIRKQYSDYKISKQTDSNIESLKSENTFAVVTGQQVAIFGGPLYTFYKIITTIKLCSQLKEKYDEYNFVPIFWMEGDDHDFEEVKSINIFDKTNSIKKIIYDDGLDEEIERGSVGSLKFNENIKSTINELEDSLRDTEYKNDLLNLIKKCYSEGTKFKEAFKKLLHSFFDEYGLIIFDPQDKEVKEILLPIFKKEIESFSDHTNEIVLKSAELDDIYHAQVKVKPVNLFYSDEKGRYLIEPVDEEFRFKGKRKRIGKIELLNLLHYDPSSFSPNVLLRPICQDYILPTAVYVGGPSELSYFAQVMPNYSFFEVVDPIIFPRSSATIIEKHIFSTLQKYDLSISDIFRKKRELINRVLKSISDIDINSLFSETKNNIDLELEKIKSTLLAIDKNLIDSTNKSMQRIFQNLEVIKEKSEKAQAAKHETVIKQLDKVRMVIYPQENLQERELSFINFANKYGLDIFKWIFNELTINKYEHQIIEL